MKMFKTIQIAAMLASAGAAASAGEPSHYLRVNVPFAFVAAGQQFVPGQYDVSETETGLITLQGQGRAAAWIGAPLAARADESALRFTNSNNREYLTSVAVEGEGTRAVPVRHAAERKVTVSGQ